MLKLNSGLVWLPSNINLYQRHEKLLLSFMNEDSYCDFRKQLLDLRHHHKSEKILLPLPASL